MWWTLYETATGEIRGHTSILPDSVDSSFTVVEHVERMDQENVWDVATRSWVARPAPILIDRLQDLADHPYAAEIWSRLTAPQRTKLRKLLVWLLAARRYREPGDTVSIESEPDWPSDPDVVVP